MPDQLTRSEFARQVKAKYPVYANVPDDQLVDKMLEKYPTYRERVIKPSGDIGLGNPAMRGGLIDSVKSAVTAYAEAGPRRVRRGLEEMGLRVFDPIDKEYAPTNARRGIHDVLVGGGVTAAPMAVPSLVRSLATAPAATTTAVGGAVAGGTAGQAIAEGGARAMGADEDTAALVGDVGAIAGGGLGAKLGQQVPHAAARWREARRSKSGLQAMFMFKQAVPPSTSAPYTQQDLDRAMPYLDVEHSGKPIQTVESLRDAADTAVSAIEGHIGTAVNAHPNDLLRANPLEAVRAKLRRSVRQSDLERGLRELDDIGLDKPLTIQQAERIRVRLNAENKAQLKKNNYDVATALKSDPAFAARETAARALRDGIYQQLEARGVDGIRNLRQDEGALLAIRNAAERQIFNAEKRVSGTGTQGPTRRVIADVTRVVPKVGPYVADAIATPNQTRDQLVRRAFELRIPADAPRMPDIPADPQIRGLLTAPSRATGPAPDNSFVRGVPAVAAPLNPNRMLPRGAIRLGPGHGYELRIDQATGDLVLVPKQ